MTAWTDAVSALSPYLWYGLDEASGAGTATDLSGNGRDGNYLNTGSITYEQASLIPGNAGGDSITFTGSPGNVMKTGLSYSSTNATYCVTIKNASDLTGQLFVGQNTNNYLSIGSSTTRLLFSAFNSVDFGYDPSALFDGNPHLIIVVAKATSAELWIDGTLISAPSHAFSSATLTQLLFKQGLGGPVASYDELVLWDTALSSSDIGDLWDAWQGTTPGTNVDLNRAAETDAAQTLTPQVGIAQALNRAAETSTARTLTPQVGIVQTLGQATETDTARLMGVVEGSYLPVNRATETSEARPLTAVVSDLIALNRAAETDAARALTVLTGGSVAVGAAAETDEARPLAAKLNILLGRATETGTAGGLSPLNLTSTHNRVSGRHRRAYAVATWEPPVVEPANTIHDYNVAIAFSAPTFDTGRPIYTTDEARAVRHRERIVIGGRDVTFFRGVTPQFDYRLIQPLSYGSATIEFPQVFPAFETLGEGALGFLKPDKTVKIQRVDTETNEVVATDYRGIITRFDASGTNLVVTVGGEIAGKAADELKPVPVFRKRREGGRLLKQLIGRLGTYPLSPRRGPETGITLWTFGGMGLLEAINQTVKMLTKRDGTQLTVKFDESANKWTFPNKDRETIHATAYFDDARLAPDLTRDTSEEPNRIYATGITDEGRKITFRAYPGLRQGPVPDFPNDDNSPIVQGDTDADTDSGDGVTIMIQRLILFGYTDRDDSADHVFDTKVMRAIKDLQEDAGLTQSGEMNVATWRALWDLDATGYTLRGAIVLPAAERGYVKHWYRTSSGAISRRNPNYDKHRRVVDRQIDMGPGHTRQQIKDWARAELSMGEANWVGTVDCNVSLIAGEHNPGDPLTEFDVFDPRAIRPGMNVWAPLFDGGTLFHVVGAQVSENGRKVQLTLDTRARDTMEAWECIKRNRETRHSSARTWLDQYRSSVREKDALITWDSVGGTIDSRVHCPADRWTVFPVVAGQAGTVEKIRIETINDKAEFVVAVFGKEISEKRLNNLIANPLSEAGTEKWTDNAVLSKLQDRVFLYSSGTHDQPLGYWPKAKTNDEGEASGAPITGVHEDEASFGYHTFAEPVLYVAIYPDRETRVKAGRIMWNQLEEGT